ncbi:MAG: hypothetical protein JSU82_17225 [Rhodospirillales bacterium]|nr:MAG: hypothetical protein JSU82_17225 [Rhodospirillales bacterium]
MMRSVILLGGLAVASFMCSPAIAQQAVCGDRDEIVARLESGYQESTTGIGLSASGGLVELYTSEKGTWTLMLSQPNGVSCLMAAGDNWEQVDRAKTASQPVY